MSMLNYTEIVENAALCIMRRPQNLKKSPTFFEIYLVTSKKVEDFFQIFVAFS